MQKGLKKEELNLYNPFTNCVSQIIQDQLKLSEEVENSLLPYFFSVLLQFYTLDFPFLLVSINNTVHFLKTLASLGQSQGEGTLST